jgi:hypothetical protein
MFVRGLNAGTYQLVAFARSLIAGTFNQARSVVVHVQSSTRVMVDIPAQNSTQSRTFIVAGWAFDGAASSGTGVDTIHIWGYPNPGSGASPVFLGVAPTVLTTRRGRAFDEFPPADTEQL